MIVRDARRVESENTPWRDPYTAQDGLWGVGGTQAPADPPRVVTPPLTASQRRRAQVREATRRYRARRAA